MINHKVKCMPMAQSSQYGVGANEEPLWKRKSTGSQIKMKPVRGQNKDIPNYRMFVVTYLGPTDTKGSRVKISDPRFKSSRTIPFGYKYDRMKDQAIDYLEKIGIKIVGYSAIDEKDYLLTRDFKTDLK